MFAKQKLQKTKKKLAKRKVILTRTIVLERSARLNLDPGRGNKGGGGDG